MDAERGTFLHAELRAEKMTRSKMTKSRDDKAGQRTWVATEVEKDEQGRRSTEQQRVVIIIILGNLLKVTQAASQTELVKLFENHCWSRDLITGTAVDI